MIVSFFVLHLCHFKRVQRYGQTHFVKIPKNRYSSGGLKFLFIFLKNAFTFPKTHQKELKTSTFMKT